MRKKIKVSRGSKKKLTLLSSFLLLSILSACSQKTAPLSQKTFSECMEVIHQEKTIGSFFSKARVEIKNDQSKKIRFWLNLWVSKDEKIFMESEGFGAPSIQALLNKEGMQVYWSADKLAWKGSSEEGTQKLLGVGLATQDLVNILSSTIKLPKKESRKVKHTKDSFLINDGKVEYMLNATTCSWEKLMNYWGHSYKINMSEKTSLDSGAYVYKKVSIQDLNRSLSWDLHKINEEKIDPKKYEWTLPKDVRWVTSWSL